MALADLAVVMNAGRIEQAGPPHEIFNSPRTAFVARFLGSHNVIGQGAAAVAVRADRVCLVRQGAARPDGSNAVPANVDGVEYQGTYVLVTMKADTGELTAMIDERDFYAAPLNAGDPVDVTWRAQDAHPLAA